MTKHSLGTVEILDILFARLSVDTELVFVFSEPLKCFVGDYDGEGLFAHCCWRIKS